MRDETSKYDLAGPTLAAFKSMLDTGVNNSSISPMTGKVVHSILSSSLLNLDEVRSVIHVEWTPDWY
jgi:hypothetical protein